ncbi:BglG family transcription antiterminator [Bacillus swezeyi]|uniref:BglG family transcription antiterminator n=1 Tax=Bacillus swezeyi TaxID=1925020 RepID=UPI0039C64A2D
MTLDQRCIAILKKMIHTSSYVSLDELMEEFNVSQRTVYYDVEKINHWLQNQQLEELNYVRSAGFYLSENSRPQIRNKLSQFKKLYHYEFSKKERIAWSAIFILTRETSIFLQDLLDKLNVSRSTLLNDIRELKEQLSQFQVKLHFHKSSGYCILGEEQNKRKVLAYYLSQVLTNRGWDELLTEIQLTIQQHQEPHMAAQMFTRKDLDTIYEILNELEPFVGVKYTDEVMQTLSVQLFLLIKRFTQGKHVSIDPVEKEVIKGTGEYQAAKYISEKIENAFSILMPEDEVFYMTTYLLGSKISDYKLTDIENQDLVNLKQIITLMVDDFQKFSCIFFQNRTDLERNLFVHLKPAYFRIKYGIELANPLAESVKQNYYDIFILTKKVVHHFEHTLGKQISNDELAYIAMHFGGWIAQEGVKVESRKKAIVVCASGIGTSRILQKQIEDLIPAVDVVKVLTVREYEKTDLFGLNFVISTTPITQKQVPVFVVNPILNNAEKASLLKQVHSLSEIKKSENIDSLLTIIEKHADIKNKQALCQELKNYFHSQKVVEKEAHRKPMLNELLTKEKIQFISEAKSWQDAITLASQPLLNDHCITNDYINAMIDSVNKLGPYIVIAPKIALPHARPEAGVIKLGMSFLQLKKGCTFSERAEHQVNLIFVLAAIDSETHLKALSQLSSLLSDQENVEKLLSAEMVDEVIEIIQKYSIH